MALWPILFIGAGLALSLGPAELIPLPHAEAAPVVKVRARTKIVMNPVRRSNVGVQVSGRLVDVFNGDPVPVARVAVRMSGQVNTATTDPNGTFRTRFQLGDGRYDIEVEYDGDEYYTPAELILGNVDVSKRSLTLTVSATEVAHSKNNIEVQIRARSDVGGVDVPIDLYAGPGLADLEHVEQISTDPDGNASYSLPRAKLGRPGRKSLQVRFRGNLAFNPAQADAEFLLTTETAISFSANSESIAFEDSFKGSGQVVDITGAGIRGEPVSLVVGSRRVGQALTDREGRFTVKAPGSAIGTGRFNVQAVFEPSKPWYRKSRSELFKVEVGEPEPVPVTYTLAAFGATALAMMAFIGLRNKPWEPWLARLKKRAPEDKNDQRQDGADEERQVSHGLQLARPSLVSSLRRPHEIDFTGVVRDGTRLRPLGGAYVKLIHSEGDVRETYTESNGRFAFKGLDNGEWRVVARAHGYVSERFTLAIPHRGELRDAHVDLLPVRERIFAMYREVAQPLLPNRELWGVWTPRQIFDHVRSERPSSALADVTDFVEETYFSQRTPLESILDHARELIDLARIELGPPADRLGP